jgi:hypothetical protein
MESELAQVESVGLSMVGLLLSSVTVDSKTDIPYIAYDRTNITDNFNFATNLGIHAFVGSLIFKMMQTLFGTSPDSPPLEMWSNAAVALLAGGTGAAFVPPVEPF